MGLKDLAKLFEKRNIIFAILVGWLLVGYITLYFRVYLADTLFARIVFFPLLTICLILFIYSFFFRGDVRHFTWKNIAKAGSFFGIAIVAYLIIGYLLISTMIDLFTSLMFVISIFSYIFITVLFSLYYCFEQGVKFDDAVYKAPTAISFPVRWGLFIFGALISVGLILLGPSLIAGEAPLVPKAIKSKELANMLYWMPLITIGIIVGLLGTAIAIIFIKGRFNAWLGIFFIFISGYITFLMVNALFTVRGGNTLPIIIARTVMFAFDLFLLLVTIGSLIGKKANLIGEKLKFMNSDAILIWLIFAKAAYEFSDHILEPGELTMMKGVAIFYLVIPLIVVMGIFGIIKYGEMKKERKRVKLRKQRVKRSKKQVEKIKKQRNKDQVNAEKNANNKK